MAQGSQGYATAEAVDLSNVDVRGHGGRSDQVRNKFPLDLIRVREDINANLGRHGSGVVCVAVGPSIVPSTPTVAYPR